MVGDDIWFDDVLGRREDAELLRAFLIARTVERQAAGVREGYVLNLNAPWGLGKTFFLERFQRDLTARGHLCAYVNGWRDDAGDEPLVAVMAALDSTLTPHLARRSQARKLWGGAQVAGGQALATITKGIVKRVVSRVAGDGLEEAVEILDDAALLPKMERSPGAGEADASDDDDEADLAGDMGDAISEIADRIMTRRLEAHRARVGSIDVFKRQMAALVRQLGDVGKVELPLFVLVDELDRCRPSYAIEMLEQIKHLFDVPGLVFVVATDTEQLAHAVKAVYGEGFDATRYLSRFFNRQYAFDEPDMDQFSALLFRSAPLDRDKLSVPFDHEPAWLFAGFARQFELSLRDAHQAYDILRSIVTVWREKVPLELALLAPLIFMHHLRRTDEFERLRTGSYPRAPGAPFAVTHRMPNTLGQPGPAEESRIEEVVTMLARRSQKDLYTNAKEAPSTNAIEAWVQALLRHEYDLLHQSRSTRGSRPMSLMTSYPRLVRSLARLSVPET